MLKLLLLVAAVMAVFGGAWLLGRPRSRRGGSATGSRWSGWLDGLIGFWPSHGEHGGADHGHSSHHDWGSHDHGGSHDFGGHDGGHGGGHGGGH